MSDSPTTPPAPPNPPGSWGPSKLRPRGVLRPKPPTEPKPVHLAIFGYNTDAVIIEGELSVQFDAAMHVPYHVMITARGDIEPSPVLLTIQYVTTVDHPRRDQWVINILAKPVNCRIVEHHEGTNPDTDYSDKLTLEWPLLTHPTSGTSGTEAALEVFFGRRV